MTCYLYPCGLLFGTNIIIARIVFYLTLCNPPTPVVATLDLPTTYTVFHNKTYPNIYVKDDFCSEYK